MLWLFFGCYFTDNTHPLHIWVEIKSSINLSCLVSSRFERKNDFRIWVRLIEGKLTELNKLNLHWIADQLSCFFQPDDWVIRSHVIEYSVKIPLLVQQFLDVRLFVGPVGHCWIELASLGRDQTLKIHKILSESPCFVEAAKTYHSSSYNLRLLDAKNWLIFELFYSVDNSEGHAHWQCRRHCDHDQIEKLDKYIDRRNHLAECLYHSKVGNDCDHKEKE